MTNTVIRSFRSDFTVLARLLIKLAIAGAVLLVLATAIGQWRAERFPSYNDLAISFFIAPAACAFLGLIFYAAVVAFPVKLLIDGLRCYDMIGRYRTVQWPEIESVEFVNLFGLLYLIVHATTLKQPLTLPVWLRDMSEFKRMVEAQAGKEHVLVQALRAVT